MWWEKFDPSRPMSEPPEKLAEELIGAGLSDEQVCQGLQVQCLVKQDQARCLLDETRKKLEAAAGQSDQEFEQQARLLYASIKRDRAANASQKLRAQQHLDELLGLPERFAAMHAGGPADADVIEAMAFYRSLLSHRRANVAQKLRAQAGLSRLRREIAKKTAPPRTSRLPAPAGEASPPTVVPTANNPVPAPPVPRSRPRSSCPVLVPVPESPGNSLCLDPLLVSKKLPPRNAACPCGSGKKYKVCCRSRDLAARP